MAALKVGDRVRVVSVDSGEGEGARRFVGQRGTVACAGRICYDWQVRFDGDFDPYWFYAHNLEPLPAAKFAVGDRVRVVSAPEPCGERFIGKIGVVYSDRCNYYSCGLKFDGGATLWFHARDLEPAPPAAAFAVGDRVRIRASGCLTTYARGHPGRVANIGTVNTLAERPGDFWYTLNHCPGEDTRSAWESDLEPFAEETTMGTQIATIDTAELKAMEAVVAATMNKNDRSCRWGDDFGNATPDAVVRDYRKLAAAEHGCDHPYLEADHAALADALEHFFAITTTERQREIRDGTAAVEVWKVVRREGADLISSNDGGGYNCIIYRVGEVIPLCVGFGTEARAREYANSMGAGYNCEFQVWRSTCERTEGCPPGLRSSSSGDDTRSCHNLRIIERVATYRTDGEVGAEPVAPEPVKCSECGGPLTPTGPATMCAPCAATKAFNNRGARIKAQIEPLLNDATIEVHMCSHPEPRCLEGRLGMYEYDTGGCWAPGGLAGQWLAIDRFGVGGIGGHLTTVDFLIHLGNIDGVRIAAREVPIEA